MAACRRAHALFSLSTGINPSITVAIGQILDSDWVDIVYPHPIEEPDTGQLISAAQVAQIGYTAFVSRPSASRSPPG